MLAYVLAADATMMASHRRSLYGIFQEGLSRIEGLSVMYPDIGDYIRH